MSADLIKAVGSLALSATAKYVAAISLTFRTEAVAALVTLTGLPRSTVYRAQGEFMQQATDEMIRYLNCPTHENPEVLTDGNPESPTDEKASEKPVSLTGIPSCAPSAGATKELPSEVVILETNTPQPPNPSLEALRAFEAYNEVALRCALPQAAKLTPARERSIRARLKTYGMGGWQRALANLEKSAFCRGQTSTNFRADLDFVCQAKSFDRLHDGGYGNGAHTAPKPTASSIRSDARMTREEADRYEAMGLL